VSVDFGAVALVDAVILAALVISARAQSRDNARPGEVGSEGELLVTGRGLLRGRTFVVALALSIGLDLALKLIRTGDGAKPLDAFDVTGAGVLGAIYVVNAAVYARRFRLVATESGIKFRRAWGRRFRFVPWESVTGVRIDALGNMDIHSRNERRLRVRAGSAGYNDLTAMIRARTRVAMPDYGLPSSRTEVRALVSEFRAKVEQHVREAEDERARRIDKR
jgi:hypothetical protein